MIYALDLPEIQEEIAALLTKDSLAVCLRVCRAWKESFEPWLWRSTIIRRWPTKAELYWMTQTLTRVERWILALDCRKGSFQFVPQRLRFVRLTNLTLNHLPGLETIQRVQLCSRTLTRLDFTQGNGYLGVTTVPFELWTALDNCHRLQDLTMFHMEILPWDWPLCLGIWSRLRSLRLHRILAKVPNEREGGGFTEGLLAFDSATAESVNSSCGSETISPNAQRTMGIQHLQLESIPRGTNLDVIELIRRCPELQSLAWTKNDGYGVDTNFMATLSALLQTDWDYTWNNKYRAIDSPNYVHDPPKFPNLVDLEIVSHADTEADLLTFLKTRERVPLQRLALKRRGLGRWESHDPKGPKGHEFGEASWRMIQKHPSHCLTITALDLRHCRLLTGSLIQEMLCSIPNLKEFSATRISDADILNDPRPWVCHNLRSLLLHFAVKFKKSSHDMIFERLSTLRYLETLDVSRPEKKPERHGQVHTVSNSSNDVDVGVDLNFRLSRGLGKLKTLRSLSYFSVLDCEDVKVQVKDVAWMIKHWPSLSQVWGKLHPDPEKHKVLVNLLSSRINQSYCGSLLQ